MQDKCEPMDISNNSNNQMDISNQSIENTVQYIEESSEISKEAIDNPKKCKGNLKTYHIKICRHHLKHRKKLSKLKFVLSGLIFTILSILVHFMINFKCSDDLDLTSIKTNLLMNLHGQSEAINGIIESFAMNESSKIIFLYGGTGVGKTFAISQILENYFNSANIYHYTMPSFSNTFSSDLMAGLTLCKNSILVVDDLRYSDMHIISHIRDVIVKSEHLGKNITIILVYNCDDVSGDFIKRCDDSFHKNLADSFKSIDTFKRFIKFQQLTEENLRKCIAKELNLKDGNEVTVNKIMKHFDVSFDGCKGVHMKLKILKIL